MSEYFMNVSFGLLIFLSMSIFVKNYKKCVIISVIISIFFFLIYAYNKIGLEAFYNIVVIIFSAPLAFLGAMMGCAFKIFADSLHEK